jgi:hypothetical protein
MAGDIYTNVANAYDKYTSKAPNKEVTEWLNTVGYQRNTYNNGNAEVRHYGMGVNANK